MDHRVYFLLEIFELQMTHPRISYVEIFHSVLLRTSP